MAHRVGKERRLYCPLATSAAKPRDHRSLSMDLAMAVLPLTTVYALCEAFGWERSVNRRISEAPVFFGLFGALLALGAIAVLVPGVPLLALLFLPNLVDGMLLPIIIVLALILVNNPSIMGKWTNSRLQNI